MKRIFTLVFFASLITSKLFSQTPDWSTSIAKILYDNCTTCHHDGGIGPFALITYNDAFDNGFQIQTDVNASKMPPWPADPNFSHFANERVLSDYELNAINDWVNGGMPQGDLDLAPPAPDYSINIYQLSNIDDSIQIPTYTLNNDYDTYRGFVIHSNYSETKLLNEIEIIPGAPSAVHHIFIFQDTSNVSWDYDAETLEPGFPGASMGGVSPYTQTLMVWGPGNSPTKFPSNMGLEMPAGADYIVSIHYAPGNVGVVDSTKVRFKFVDANDPNPRAIGNYRLLHWHVPSLLNPPFIIPADQYKTFYETSQPSPFDQSLIALQPHMHLLGKSFKVMLANAPGDSTNMVYIPEWSFNWQLAYYVPQIMKINQGTTFYGTGEYDNTTNNPNNPNNPPIDVGAGESTLEEMMSCRFYMMKYQSGDENIVLDSSIYLSDFTKVVLQNLEVKVFPNPVSDQLNFITSIPEHNIYWNLRNEVGSIVRASNEINIPNGIYYKEVDVKDLPSGNYYLCVYSGNEKSIQKISVIK
jgi:hypothetical protein